MRFAIYDPDSREIRAVVDCPVQQIDASLQPGEAFVEVAEGVSDLSHQVVDGEPVAYSVEQAALKASRPRRPCAWSNVTHSWTDLRDLAQVKVDRWAAMKAARDAFEFGGFTWDGATFDSDPASQSRIQGASQLATLAGISGSPFSIDWTLQDNRVRTLSGADMLAVGMAMGSHIATAHAIGRDLRQAIEAAVSVAAVEAVAWP
ncbi:DUF4376 domain-containing protein [Methylibium petroleiphilum]